VVEHGSTPGQPRAEEGLPKIRKIRDRRGIHCVAAGTCVLVLERADGAAFFEYLDADLGYPARVWLSDVLAVEEAV
jgi:hypothetical protein